MKKILYIVTSLSAGGEEKFLLDIYPLLTNKLNHIICPLVHAGELYPHKQKINLENSKNNPFWIWLFKTRTLPAKMLKPIFWFYYVLRISRILKYENPDAVITCTPDSSFSLGMYKLITFGNQKKYTWYYRVGTHFYPNGYLPPLFRNKITQPLMTKVMTHIGTFLMKIRINRADQFIVVNSTLKRELMNFHHVTPKNIFLLPVSLTNTTSSFKNPRHEMPGISDGKENGYFLKGSLDPALKRGDCASPPVQQYTPKNASFRVDKNKIYFVAAGRLKYVKGFDFLIDAIAPLLKERSDIILVILGEGPEKFRLLKQIKLHGLEEKILLPGFIYHPTEFIQDPTAYIVPSRSEGFGKLIIEAMNMRSIVIASNCSGPTEIIEDGIDGVLFERENSLSLISAIRKILVMSENHKIQMKTNAHIKSLHFTLENITMQLNAKLESDLL